MKLRRTVALIVGLIFVILLLTSFSVYGADYNSLSSDEDIMALARAIGLVFGLSLLIKFGGKAIDGAKDYILGSGGYGDASEKQRLRRENSEKRRNNREAKRRQKSSSGRGGYGSGDNKIDFPIEPIAFLIGGAFAAGDWIVDKARSAGRWVKNKFHKEKDEKQEN